VLKAKCGRIDILVNNAGITQPRKTLDITPPTTTPCWT
jgi:NAD(P)-dependent dehydrogenase (short-subunit alcohol dehydrogenase family)